MIMTQEQDTSAVAQRIAELDFAAALRESQNKVIGWIEGFITHLPNLVAAFIVFAVFLVLARIVRGVVGRLLARTSRAPDVNRLISTLSFIFVLFAGVFFALDVLNLDRTVSSLLAGAGIVGLALGFAFQETAENFISGVFLAVRKQFTDGDIIETNDYRGLVESVNLRATLLRTFDGQIVTIPNSKVYKEVLVNYSALGTRRVDVEVGVSYGDDLRRAAELALDAVAGVPGRIEGRDAEVFYKEFGDSSINFLIRFWITYGAEVDFLRARSEAIIRIKGAFDANDVTIPFPIRTLDFSRVGGVTLGEEWPGARAARG